MDLAKLLKVPVFLAVLALVASAAAQIRYEDFSDDPSYLLLDRNGPVHRDTWNGLTVLRLTDGPGANNEGPQASSVWFGVRQRMTAGFTSYFKFIFHNPVTCCAPGDGVAFVIQNASYTDPSYCASGAQGTALGAAQGGLGYAGIPNSIAIEFDTRQDAWDPNPNHVALQSCGTKPNTPVHGEGVYSICSNNQVTSCLYNGNISTTIPPLGVTCGDGGCIDGIPVSVVVEYTGTLVSDPHHLKVYVDPLFIPGTHTPVANAVPQIDVKPFTIENVIQIGQTASRSALVGFTASQASDSQTTDLIAWEFTPHTSVQIQEQLNNNNVENQFNFGDHVYGVKYPANSFNGIFFMTVNAIPIDQATFYNTRLKNNTLFNNEQCIRYYSTGNGPGIDGNDGPSCIVYEVTCQDQNHNNVSCPNPNNNQLIDTRTSYGTPDPVNANNADYIKATIGTNNWCSIFTNFQQNGGDPTTSGSGNNFSDFVATFKTGPGQDPQCPPPGSARNMFRKLPQTNASAALASDRQQEPGPAGSNK